MPSPPNSTVAATLLDAAATRVLDRHHTREALGLVEMAVDGGMRGLAATCAAPAATPASTPQQYLAWLHDHASACYAQAMEAAHGSRAGAELWGQGCGANRGTP